MKNTLLEENFPNNQSKHVISVFKDTAKHKTPLFQKLFQALSQWEGPKTEWVYLALKNYIMVGIWTPDLMSEKLFGDLTCPWLQCIKVIFYP